MNIIEMRWEMEEKFWECYFQIIKKMIFFFHPKNIKLWTIFGYIQYIYTGFKQRNLAFFDFQGHFANHKA